MTAITYHRAGLREIGDAALLELAGRCGTAGIISTDAEEAMRRPAGTVRGGFFRLIEAGLIHPPSRDSKCGRPNRYVITPAGMALLQKQEAVVLPAQQIPMPLS